MRTHYSNEITQKSDGKSVILYGWVHEIRDLGKLKFLILRDRDGFIQITARKGATEDAVRHKIEELSKESVIEVTGTVKLNEQAPKGVEIFPSSIKTINKSKSPLPLDVTEKVRADLDTRLNNRFMDLRKPRIAAIFKIRDNVLRAGREFLANNSFIEIHTPKIIASASEGGTELFPLSYFDKEAFLAQSPQLYKQMMMATGFDRVYEVTYYFRAEEHDTRRHLNEITAIDIEMAFIKDENDVMNILEGLVKSIIKSCSKCEELKVLGKEISVPTDIRRITYDGAVEMLKDHKKFIQWGEDLDTEAEKLLGRIMKEEYNSELYFLTQYPLKIKPFYTMPAKNHKYSRSFDLGYKGVEIASGGQRIHCHDLLTERIEHLGLGKTGLEFYLNAFEYGMPPHGGFGLGIDRIMMQLLDMPVREVVLFPRDRHRLVP